MVQIIVSFFFFKQKNIHSGFLFDETTGLVDVGFNPVKNNKFTSSFSDRPAVKLYSSLVSDWKEGTKYLSWFWIYNKENIQAQLNYISKKL
jgi:hypothetical protein